MWSDQPAEGRLSLKDMKGLIILILFLLKFIITLFLPPTCPGRTKGGNINTQKPPSIWLRKKKAPMGDALRSGNGLMARGWQADQGRP